MNPFLENLAETYGTPFYAYDLGLVRDRIREIRALMPDGIRARLLYSLKSNPLPSLVGEVVSNGCMVDLTSVGEIRAATAAGFRGSEALFGGPGKSADEVDTALSCGICNFSIESWHDLAVIGRAARSRGLKVRGLFRINPSEPPRARVAMSGVASQFGFEEVDVVSHARDRMAEFQDAVEMQGIHVYWGTQIDGHEVLGAAFASALETAERVAGAIGMPLRILNLGGGFPWPYAQAGVTADLRPLRDHLAAMHHRAGEGRTAEWWFESGRYVSASSGTLVARVVDVKTSKGGRRFVVLDTGIHHLGGLSGLGRIPRFSVDIDVPSDNRGAGSFDIVGQLCTPLDCIGRNQTLPEPSVGDLVSIPNVGAYGLTASLVAFLSRPSPCEIAYRDDRVVAVHRLRTGHETLESAGPGLDIDASAGESPRKSSC